MCTSIVVSQIPHFFPLLKLRNLNATIFKRFVFPHRVWFAYWRKCLLWIQTMIRVVNAALCDFGYCLGTRFHAQRVFFFLFSRHSKYRQFHSFEADYGISLELSFRCDREHFRGWTVTRHESHSIRGKPHNSLTTFEDFLF